MQKQTCRTTACLPECPDAHYVKVIRLGNVAVCGWGLCVLLAGLDLCEVYKNFCPCSLDISWCNKMRLYRFVPLSAVRPRRHCGWHRRPEELTTWHENGFKLQALQGLALLKASRCNVPWCRLAGLSHMQLHLFASTQIVASCVDIAWGTYHQDPATADDATGWQFSCPRPAARGQLASSQPGVLAEQGASRLFPWIIHETCDLQTAFWLKNALLCGRMPRQLCMFCIVLSCFNLGVASWHCPSNR